MQLYLLTRIDSVNYDEVCGMVIRAEDLLCATQIANMHTGMEGEIWGDSAKVNCEILTNEGTSDLIISDFKAG